MPDAKFSRRGLIARGGAALAGMALLRSDGSAASASSPQPDTITGKNWPKHRAKFERAWLDLLGDFPKEIPPLLPLMKQVAVENGITRYHVSFQSEADDRVTVWLL